MEYVVSGDGAKGRILSCFSRDRRNTPDWPMQMITNSASSPEIVKTAAYIASEDGPISLAHDYYLVLFDYPGVAPGRWPALSLAMRSRAMSMRSWEM